MAQPAAGPDLPGHIHRRIVVKVGDGQVTNRSARTAGTCADSNRPWCCGRSDNPSSARQALDHPEYLCATILST